MDIRVIEARLRKLNAYVGKLKIYRNVDSDEYLRNEDMQAIVERRLQLAIQVCMDISNYIIAHRRLEIPDEEENIFVVLGSNHIIPRVLAKRIKGMVRFRNILVHDYLEINPAIVYNIMKQSLQDLDEFARAIVRWLDRDG
ncbi:MAG: type VII toxin-antitoxin system HepT family RNase toxin [Bacillota bacterium]